MSCIISKIILIVVFYFLNISMNEKQNYKIAAYFNFILYIYKWLFNLLKNQQI